MSQVSPTVGRESDPPVSTDAAEGVNSGALGISTGTWVKVSIIVALMASLFWPNLHRLWDKTNPFYGEANWGHAICVPIISLYFLYVNREKLLNPRPDPWSGMVSGSLWAWGVFQMALCLSLLWVWLFAEEYLKVSAIGVGLAGIIGFGIARWGRRNALLQQAADVSAAWFGAYILLFGIALYGYGIYPGQNDFIKDFGMVVTIFGVGLMLAGWGRMQIGWFSVAFLVCAIPWPGLVYSKVAGPLQQLAANVAVWTLEMTGVESSASGTKIFIKGFQGAVRTLNVAEACAGLRSLMTFISVAGAVAFLSHRPLWQKLIVTVSAIPIAIFCNVMRVAGQGLLDHYVSQQLSESFAHQFVGMIMLIPAFLLILLVGWVLDQIFMEELDRKRNWHATVVRRLPATETLPVAGPTQAPTPGRSLAARRAAEAAANPIAAPAAGAVAPATPKPLSPKPQSPKPQIPRPVGLTPPPSVRLAQGRPTVRPPAQKPPAYGSPVQPKPPEGTQPRGI